MTLLVRVISSFTTPLNAVPPVKHTSLGSPSASADLLRAVCGADFLPSPARGLTDVSSPSVTSATMASAPLVVPSVLFGSTARSKRARPS